MGNFSNTGPLIYHVAKTFISRDGGVMINTINIKQRKLKTAAGGSVTQVLSNLSGTALTVDGGAGANIFAIGDVQGIVQLNGASSADTVQFNDQGYASGDSYLLVGKILDVGRLADFNVFLDGISHFALNTGSGDDVIILDNPDPELQLALDGGPGSDEVIVAAGVVTGPHLVNMEAVNITGGEEPALQEKTSKAERVPILAQWVDAREQAGAKHVGAKHPLLSLCGDDLLEAWGGATHFIWSHRPLEESIRSLTALGWWPGSEEYVQRRLYDAASRFFERQSHLRVEFGEITSHPSRQVERAIHYLGITPDNEQIRSAVASIQPRNKSLGA